MADPITFDSIDVSMSTTLQDTGLKPQPDSSFRILILGDFSGRANRGVDSRDPDIGRRRIHRVDRDNLDAVMEKMAVSLNLDAAGSGAPPVELSFTEMDDFHPDRIYRRSQLFKSMKDLRKGVIKAETFAEIASRFSGKAKTPSQTGSEGAISSPREPDFAGETHAGLLDQVLDASAPASAGPGKTGPQTDWDRFLADIVSPHLVPDIAKEQDAMVGAVDRTISEIMGRLLHHPDFQAVESAWRGLDYCLRRLETGEKLEVCLLDVTKTELASDLTACEDLRDTALHNKLAAPFRRQGGQASWSLLAGMYHFLPTKTDAVVLARMGAMGQMLGAAVIGGADPGFVGCPSLFEAPDPSDWTLEPDPADRQAWQVLRTLPEARWIGLALPRFIVRWPYGADTDPLEAFAFEEMNDPVNHEDYLWANPVFALVLVFGRTFARNGRDWSRGLVSDVSDLPLHVFTDRGERGIKPCGEAFLSDRAIEKMVACGLMPLVSFRDEGRIQLVRFQSVAATASPLAGPWTV
ncbi:hypothetical protein DSCA_11180 [Desulfosarcina alkanivorans]|uniref:TssC1 N-terminal domain-containing protein n=1 Tax=Desulfosarcina alkanivorans TaxID=571177 RepID=A0A5K7YDG9_9BACT|nr:type VI secretion system contractile sheath large subunit [Desulfosarcina alkanivorans]BBO67188.1 hypothetical protein DSCA_11180 [Desulfosarcina alkanivorans]